MNWLSTTIYTATRTGHCLDELDMMEILALYLLQNSDYMLNTVNRDTLLGVDSLALAIAVSPSYSQAGGLGEVLRLIYGLYYLAQCWVDILLGYYTINLGFLVS